MWCGVGCRFRLTATDSTRRAGASGGVAYAQVTVTVNLPPFGGLCSAVLSDGSSNSYVLSCWGWASPNPPLQYQFSWISSTNAIETLLCSPQPSNTLTVALPFGNCTVYAYVFDSYGARTLGAALSVFTALPSAAVTDPLGYAQNLTSSLSTALTSQDSTGGLAIIGVLTSLVNSAPTSGSSGSSSSGGSPDPTSTALRSSIINALNTYVALSLSLPL